MKITLIVLAVVMTAGLHAQKYYTKTGDISFFSDAEKEKIEAVNHKATSVIDSETGNIQWSVLVKAFHFEKALMEEHFNENYMESSKFPKATFKGKINNVDEIEFSTPGQYVANISGVLQIHGVSNDVETTADISVDDTGAVASCEFTVLVEDYDIDIPSVVMNNIAKSIKIVVNASYLVLE